MAFSSRLFAPSLQRSCAILSAPSFASRSPSAFSTGQRAWQSTMASREKIVVVGTGWAGYAVAHGLDDKKFDIRVISPEAAFPYTPLLASACVGLFDFALAQEPIRSKTQDLRYYKAKVEDVDIQRKVLRCRGEAQLAEHPKGNEEFEMDYDRLVLTPGYVDCHSITAHPLTRLQLHRQHFQHSWRVRARFLSEERP